MKEKLLELIFTIIDFNKKELLEVQEEETKNECRKNIKECEELLDSILINKKEEE